MFSANELIDTTFNVEGLRLKGMKEKMLIDNFPQDRLVRDEFGLETVALANLVFHPKEIF